VQKSVLEGQLLEEQRIIASLILLFGLTMLALGLHYGELGAILDLVKQVFQPVLAGLP